MRHLEETLEAIKQMRHYSVTLSFGEDIGCDDLDVPLYDRRIFIVAVPVGYLGEVRRAWVGKMSEIALMDLSTPPVLLSNPPGGIPTEAGSYAWGADGSIVDYMKEVELS